MRSVLGVISDRTAFTIGWLPTLQTMFCSNCTLAVAWRTAKDVGSDVALEWASQSGWLCSAGATHVSRRGFSSLYS